MNRSGRASVLAIRLVGSPPHPQEKLRAFAGVSSVEPSLICRQDAGNTLRFTESFDLQDGTRIGAMKRLAEVGRVTPCAPSFALKEGMVAAAGAQRTARHTLWFTGRFGFAALLACAAG